MAQLSDEQNTSTLESAPASSESGAIPVSPVSGLSELIRTTSYSTRARRYSDQSVATLHAMESIAKELKPTEQAQLQQLNLHHLAVLKKHLLFHIQRDRGSTGSLLHLEVAAASPAATASGSAGKDDKRYEQMVQRFQIRRLDSPAAGAMDHTSSQRNLRRGSGSTVFNVRMGQALDQPPRVDHAESAGRRYSFSRSPSKHGRHRNSLIDTRATIVDMSTATTATTHPTSGVSVVVGTDDKTPSSIKSRLEKLYLEGTSLRWVFIAWQRKFARKCRRMVRRLKKPMSPFSGVFRLRVAALSLALFAYTVSFPLNIAFSSKTEQGWTRIVDYTVEFVSLADFLLMFNTAFVNKSGEVVTTRRDIALHYVTGWGVLDVWSSMPWHFMIEMIYEKEPKWSGENVLLLDVAPRILRIVHLVLDVQFIWNSRPSRTGKSMWDWLLYSRYSHLLRIVFIIVCIIVTAHYLACAWKMLSPETTALFRRSPFEIYASSFYDALQLLQGQGVPTSTLGQNAFASFSVLVGSIVLAIIFGHVAMLVANFNANSTNYQRKMESVFAIMTKMELPAPLRERIHQYYDHLWREYESLDGEIGRFSKGLSHTLELEVMLYKYMELIVHIPFWKACSSDFQKQLMLNLRVRVYLPDDFIIRRGEVGDEFYMINHGSVEHETSPDSTERATAPLRKKDATGLSELAEFMGTKLLPTASLGDSDRDGDDESDSCSDDDDDYSRDKRRKIRAKRSIYRTENFDDDEDDHIGAGHPLRTARANKHIKKLSRGQAFGEMALLINYERTASARAITYVEMCVLTRSDFQRILARYPDDRTLVTLSILTNYIEKNESSRVACPLMEAVRTVYGEGDPVKSAAITPKFAAEQIARIVSPEIEDDSIRFGIGIKLQQQLVAYRDALLAKHESGELSESPPRSETEQKAQERVEQQQSTTKSHTQVSLVQPDQQQHQQQQVPAALLARIDAIEQTQTEVLRCMTEMRGIITEMQRARQAQGRVPHT